MNKKKKKILIKRFFFVVLTVFLTLLLILTNSFPVFLSIMIAKALLFLELLFSQNFPFYHSVKDAWRERHE